MRAQSIIERGGYSHNPDVIHNKTIPITKKKFKGYCLNRVCELFSGIKFQNHDSKAGDQVFTHITEDYSKWQCPNCKNALKWL